MRIAGILPLLFTIAMLASSCAGAVDDESEWNDLATSEANLTSTEAQATERDIRPDEGSGATRISPVDGMVQVYVPAGTFLMGSDASDTYADYDEFPQHEVYLDAYWIDQTEVTNAMFAAFLNAEGNRSEGGATWLDAEDWSSWINVSGDTWVADERFEDNPVVAVTWYGARAYCVWAERRLPTEAEWEKAARGDDGRLFPWGNTRPTCSRANHNNCMWQSNAVGLYPDGASPYSALDMAGNVWEWVMDWYDGDYYENSPSENPGGPTTGSYRVLRGGAHDNLPEFLRVTFRNTCVPDYAYYSIGFRCAVSP